MQLQLRPHYITQRYTTLITLHFTTTTTTATTAITTTTTLRYTTLITLHWTKTTATLPYTTLDYITLYHTTPHNTPRHYTALQYTNYTTPRLQLQLHLQLHIIITLHYSYNSTPLHYNYKYNRNYNYNCATPHYIQQLWWGDHCNHFKKHDSNHLSVHQWNGSAIRDSQKTNLSYRFPIFENSATALCGTTGIVICNLHFDVGLTVHTDLCAQSQPAMLIASDNMLLPEIWGWANAGLHATTWGCQKKCQNDSEWRNMLVWRCLKTCCCWFSSKL